MPYVHFDYYVIIFLSSSGMAHGRISPVLRFHAIKLSPNTLSFSVIFFLWILCYDCFFRATRLRYNPEKMRRKIRGHNESLVSRPLMSNKRE